VLHLSCASTHLTAFWGAAGGAAARFSVNNVHPIDDAGDLKACSPRTYKHASVHSASRRIGQEEVDCCVGCWEPYHVGRTSTCEHCPKP
jgi:hypothetical protein